MTRKRTPTPPAKPNPYRPQVGELVKDRRTGRLGTYMDMRGGEAYLRPPEGGTEWTTNPASIERYGDESRVVVNIIPDRRYPVPGAGSADAA